ncbi:MULTISPECIES: hypothetical protein [unclassified Streptomyces]|uniref:hypothetical protein n=1 Tax=unclassified Streptomyces TaxID=2593676 RepID=UPI001661803A|nr:MULTISPECIES: hypothetical protein [unclassified Streptomyces]MBD0710315.1 hypothetical protein [Streptomyces sp. CBMA291]MBD0717428.1 hypothetical protein [Streptomyces sp. CBMA370]
MSAVDLRVAGAVAAVTVAVLLPLLVTAGWTTGPTGVPAAESGPVPRTPGFAVDSVGSAESVGSVGSVGYGGYGGSGGSVDFVVSAGERVARCGPELVSPDGVEAQTCVLAEGSEAWARTYYRNASGQDLDAFLTLMTPGGRTVQVHCAVTAQDEPGSCETPRERDRGGAAASTAVAEFAGAGEGGSTPLLLRAESNRPFAEGS